MMSDEITAFHYCKNCNDVTPCIVSPSGNKMNCEDCGRTVKSKSSEDTNQWNKIYKDEGVIIYE
jgi:exosome complex RNA-binding protein Csl4